jgi:hypothetical protein
VAWRPTKVMNMRDLSRDDDFLSHLLVEKLGNGTVPLLVHKMDPSRRLPKTDAGELLRIVQRVSVWPWICALSMERRGIDALLTHFCRIACLSKAECAAGRLSSS